MLLLQGRISPPSPTPHQKNVILCVIGRVRFERNCGKMYSRHLFPYGRLLIDAMATRTSLKKKKFAFPQSTSQLFLPTYFVKCRLNPLKLNFKGQYTSSERE